MIDGIYSITFRGYADWGMGLLLLHHGVITGADMGGVVFDGKYTDQGDAIHAQIQMVVPAGGALVQGTPPQPHPYRIDFQAAIPKRALDTGETVPVDMPPGPVNVIFRRLRSLAT